MLLRLSLTSRSPPKVASHKSLVVGDHLYVLGGYSFMPRDRLKIYRHICVSCVLFELSRLLLSLLRGGLINYLQETF